LPETDVWGVGIMAMTDKTANGILTSNYLSLSTAYHKSLDEDGLNQIGVGFQGTYATKRLDGTQLHFEDGLLDNGAWTVSPSEPINTQVVNIHYFDMNAGLLYNGSSNGSNNYYVGASVYHVNRPKVSFLGSDTFFLQPRLTVHGGGSFNLDQSNNFLYFSGLYSRQAAATDIVVGGAFAINANNDVNNPTNVYVGSWARFNNVTDALIPYVGLEFGSFSVGLSYDVNISSLKSASQSRGGVELSLIYIKHASDGHHSVPCPKF
jgi:type IX secretion system PorP/SprF family membrane protein